MAGRITMNLWVRSSLDGVKDLPLPPPRAEGPRAQPTRVLFLSTDALGWKTNNRQLIRATEHRADVTACHLLVGWPKWMALLNHRVPGFREHFVSPARVWRWLMRRWLTGPLDASRFDVIHANSQVTIWAGADLKPRYDYKLSVACDTTERQFNRELAVFPNDRDLCDPDIFAAADLLVPWSTWCAGSLTGDYGVDPARILVTPPVVQRPAVIPERPPDDGRPLRIVFVGNDWERKGGPRLLAWHQDRWAARGVELHVASADAANFPPAARVTWHGRLGHDAVMALVASADLLVHPTHRDMSAIVVAEAQTLGVPAVASRLAGIPDLLDDGVSGLLVDPADDAGFVAAVERVLFDRPLRTAMSAAAIQFARSSLDFDVVYGRLIDRIVALDRSDANAGVAASAAVRD